MRKKVTHKSKHLQLILGLMLVFLVLPIKQGWAEPRSTLGNDAADKVDVIVSDTPLRIPQEFKAAVTRLGGKFIIIGDGKTVRLLSLGGNYFNPCLSESSGKIDMSVFNQATNTCKFAAGLGETNMVLAQKLGDNGGGGGPGCATCTANSASRWCKKSTNKYTCTTQSGSCKTNC